MNVSSVLSVRDCSEFCRDFIVKFESNLKLQQRNGLKDVHCKRKVKFINLLRCNKFSFEFMYNILTKKRKLVSDFVSLLTHVPATPSFINSSTRVIFEKSRRLDF